MDLIKLFFIFFKIGLFTFGGGYAMIPLIKTELITKRNWISEDEMIEILAIAESTPGPQAVNMATYIGYKRGKVLGSLLATLGVILPSIIIILLISIFLKQFEENEYVKYAFVGINASVCILIITAGISLFSNVKHNILTIILFILVLGFYLVFDIINFSFSSIYYILICGLISLIYYIIKDNRGNNK